MKSLKIIFVGLSFVIGLGVFAQAQSTCQIDPSAKPTKVGKSLQRFGKANSQIFRGARPKTNEDFDYLKSLGVKTIISLEIMDTHKDSVSKKAKEFGIKFISTPVEGSFVSPSPESVNAALDALTDRNNYPVYVHCALGRDRTSFIIALYRVFQEKCSVPEARAEMRLFGLPDGSIFLSGLNRFFDTQVRGLPDWDVEPTKSSKNP